MLQKKQAQLLRDEIEEVLTDLSGSPGFQVMVREPLTKPRRGLNYEAGQECPWSLLPVLVADAICGYGERALPVAASLQVILAAGDVFDDIEDADSPDSICAIHGVAVATSVASTLLVLGERCLTRLVFAGADTGKIVHVIDTVNSFYTKACTGQYLDLTTENLLSEDTYLKIISMKSAAQFACACYAGALVAGAEQEMIDKFAAFGHNLGMASQISNDIQGITSGKDIVRSAITFPVIYALNVQDTNISNVFTRFYHDKASSIDNIQLMKDMFFHAGAIHYSTVKMEVYKQMATDILLDVKKAGLDVDRLKAFLE